MRYFAIAAATTLSLALGATVSNAQHYRRTVQATVDTVDVQSRILELKRPEGFFIRLHVPESFTNLATIKVGDTVNCTYYENVIRKIDKAGGEVAKREPVTPPKTAAEAHENPDLIRKVTATVTAIDTKLGNLSFTDVATDRLYSARTETPDMLKKVKVGDKVDLTYTQATLFELK
jgi:hypothetical protein